MADDRFEYDIIFSLFKVSVSIVTLAVWDGRGGF